MPRTYTYLKSFHINNKGIEAIGLGPETRQMVRDVARKAMAHAVKISPEEHGQYKESFRIGVHVRRDWPIGSPYRAARACADLSNVHPGALWIEKGSVRRRKDGTETAVPGHYVLTRTLAHLSIKGKGKGKPKASK